MSDAKLLEFENIVGKHFVGVVVDNNDPLKLCRIKVMVPELFTGYPTEALPWMTCTQRVFRGQTGDKDDLQNSPRCGSVFIPRVGSRVLCIFDKGNINSGIVREELIDGRMTNDPELLEDYPSSYGWTDENNTKVVINTKQKTLHVHHRGVTIDIDSEGNLTIHSPSSISIDSEESISVASPVINMTASETIGLTAGNLITISASQVITESLG